MIEKDLEEVNQLINKRQIPVALKKIQPLLQKLENPSKEQYELYVEVVLTLGNIHVKLFKNIEAINELKKAHEKFPCEKRFISEILSLAKKIKREDLISEFTEYVEILDKDNIYGNTVQVYDELKAKKDLTNAVFQLKKLINTGSHEENLYRKISSDLKDLNLVYESLEYEKDLQSMFEVSELEIFNQIDRLYSLKNFKEAYKLLQGALLYFHKSGTNEEQIKKYVDAYYNLIILFDSDLFSRLGYEPEAYKAYKQDIAKDLAARIARTIF
jgi:hypothetical protein